MLQLHLANRFETLSALLQARLTETAGGDPFDAPTIIVPSAAVQRRLTLDLADGQGVCAGVEFGFLAHWLWQQMRRLLPAIAAQPPLAPAVLAWRVYAQLGDADFVAGQPRLGHYLAGADETMRLELARRVAGLLDQYATYRPQWLARWQQDQPAGLSVDAAGLSANPDEAWQAALWRRLADRIGLDATHPAQAFVEAIERSDAGQLHRAGLPRTAHLFALPTLAPLHAALLERLSQRIDLHLYLLNPCQEYWYELVDRRRLAWLASRGRDAGHEVGNRLLAAWGRQTQALVDGLLERAGDAVVDSHHFEPRAGDTLLARWQNAVLAMEELPPASVAMRSDDRSVEVHVCHSLTRELEVLHDRLLARFAADPTLRPADVLVVTPDLESAAPLVDAVFGAAPPARALPYALTGRARSRVNAPARALLAILDLAASRMTASALMAVLQQPIVARRFGLDADGLDALHEALIASGLRWGLDGAHRASAGLPADERHTLADALDRLYLGHAMPADAVAPVAGLLPAGDLEGSEALPLAALQRVADALQALHHQVGQALPPARWATLLQALLGQFLAPAADELADLSELQDSLRSLAATIARAELEEPLPLPVMRAALAQALDDPARGGVPGGRITFSAMSPLRGLPYRLIAVVGLDGGAFPSIEHPPEFDLMAAHPRRGDRQRRQDDRNVFLDLLLAARDAVHLSHTGRSVRDNSALPPSVLIDEWLDVLVPAIAVDPDQAAALKTARARLVVDQPLQSFAIDAFRADADPRLRSHRQELCDALLARLRVAGPAAPAIDLPTPDEGISPPGAGDPAAPSDEPDSDDDRATAWAPSRPFFDAPLPPPGEAERTLTLDDLLAFFQQPARTLLRRRLGLALAWEAEPLQDDEPFVVEPVERWALAQRLLPALLAGADDAALGELAAAGTDWPAGALGQAPLRSLLTQLRPFAERLRPVLAAPLLPTHAGRVTLTLDGETWHIDAAFTDLRAQGLLRWRAAALRPRDRLAAWFPQLWLAARPPPGGVPPTTWLALDGPLRLRPPADPSEARTLMADLLRIYRDGLSAPQAFFPASSWAYVAAGNDLAKARASFQPGPHQAWAEGTEEANRLAWRGLGDPLGPAFESIAQAVFGPLVEHTEPGA